MSDDTPKNLSPHQGTSLEVLFSIRNSYRSLSVSHVAYWLQYAVTLDHLSLCNSKEDLMMRFVLFAFKLFMSTGHFHGNICQIHCI